MAEINEVEKLIDTNWDDVELNAQRSQAGQIFKLRVCSTWLYRSVGVFQKYTQFFVAVFFFCFFF